MGGPRHAFFLRQAIIAQPSLPVGDHLMQIGRDAPDERVIWAAFYEMYGCTPDDYRNLRTLVASLHSHARDWLFHGTDTAGAERAAAGGFAGRSHWGTAPVAGYFAEEAAERKAGWTMMAAPRGAFDVALLEPDIAMIREPLTRTVGLTERQVRARWEASRQDWAASLRIGGAVIYRGHLNAEDIMTLRRPGDIDILASRLPDAPPRPGAR